MINNAIVLIDRIEIEIRDFERIPSDAVVEAALQRFRPIILTTFATSFRVDSIVSGGRNYVGAISNIHYDRSVICNNHHFVVYSCLIQVFYTM